MMKPVVGHAPARELVGQQDQQVFLFEGIESADVIQGKLANCWLMGTIAAIAEFPEAVKALFREQELTEDGIYHIRLFDIATQLWQEVEVDELVPYNLNAHGRMVPAFSRPVGNEIWVLLLEKAIATYAGGYEQLVAGMPAFALQVLLGPKRCWLYVKGDIALWLLSLAVSRGGVETVLLQELEAQVVGDSGMTESSWIESHSEVAVQQICGTRNPKAFSYDLARTMMESPQHDRDDLWNKLHCDLNGPHVMVALYYALIVSGPQRENGLIDDHCYSIISLKEAPIGHTRTLRMICLRNPHARGEWNGEWSDDSPLWDLNPLAQEACDFTPDNNDGLFWLSFDDFLENFNAVEVAPVDMME